MGLRERSLFGGKMPTDLEKQFFDTFGIEPKEDEHCQIEDNWLNDYQLKITTPISEYMKQNAPCKSTKICSTACQYRYTTKEYPEITDRQYLELIVLHNIYLETKLYHLELKSLKEEILQDLIYEQQLREIKKDDVSDDLKHQVQAIFKGE